MCKVIFLFLFVVATINGVKLDEPNPANECTISFNVLHKLGTSLSAGRDESFGNFSDCSEVINATLQVSSHILERIKMGINESRHDLEEKEKPLQSTEMKIVLQLKSLLENPTTDYEDFIIAMRIKLDDFKNEFYSAIKKTNSLNEKNDFYDLSDHQTHEEDSESCTLSNEDGHLLIANLNEIYSILTETDLEKNCEVAVGRLMNIKSVIVNRDIFEQKILDSVNRIYAERKRFLEILIDNAKNKNFVNIEHDKFEDLQKFSNELGASNDELGRVVAKKAFHFAVKNIQTRRRFSETDVALEDSKPEYNSPLHSAVVRAYECNKDVFKNVTEFIRFKKWEGDSVLKHALEMCEHIDDPTVVKFHDLMKNGGFDSKDSLLYQFFASRENHPTELNVRSRNSLSFSILTFIISKYSVQPQEIANILYEEMMALGYVDTTQHVMFGFWLKKLMENTTEDTDILENIKQRLPEAIRTLVFEPKFFISTPNNDCFLPDYNVSVFTVSPIVENFFVQIQIDETQMLYSTEVDNQAVVKIATSFSDIMYQWYFMPTDNATSFYIKNANGKFLSSEFYGKNLKLHEDNGLTQKWTVSVQLPERNVKTVQ